MPIRWKTLARKWIAGTLKRAAHRIYTPEAVPQTVFHHLGYTTADLQEIAEAWQQAETEVRRMYLNRR